MQEQIIATIQQASLRVAIFLCVNMIKDTANIIKMTVVYCSLLGGGFKETVLKKFHPGVNLQCRGCKSLIEGMSVFFFSHSLIFLFVCFSFFMKGREATLE